MAELDLQMRGPGEVYGVKQSGIPDLKVASLADLDFLTKVRSYAQHLIDEDPGLDKYGRLKDKITKIEAQMELKDAA